MPGSPEEPPPSPASPAIAPPAPPLPAILPLSPVPPLLAWPAFAPPLPSLGEGVSPPSPPAGAPACIEPPLFVGSPPVSPPALASDSRAERPHAIRATAPRPTHPIIRPSPRLIPTLSHCLSRSTRGRKCPPALLRSERPEEARRSANPPDTPD